MTEKIFRKVYDAFPGWELKEKIKFHYLLSQRKALINELINIPIYDSGTENIHGNTIPFVQLENGTIFLGRYPNSFERELYRVCQNKIHPKLTEDTVRVAMDIILRYLYPHAMPNIVLPYPRSARKCFHPQHIETIEDLPGLSLVQKQELKTLYSPKPGESFLDVGAYMGYGTLRLRKELGSDSLMIAVEADPDALELLQQNINRNYSSNDFTIVPRAIWKENNVDLNFYQSERQANSLINNIVESNNNTLVKTITVDTILQNYSGGAIDIVSMTVNGAEVEALEGMKETLKSNRHIRLSIAGWYKRDNCKICDIISPILREQGLQVLVGRKGGVLAWK